MPTLQHIVALKASRKYNNPARVQIVAFDHIRGMGFDDANGGPNHLRAWRLHARLSQEELADAIGTSHQVIGYLERGRTALSAKWLRLIAPRLGTTPGMLLDHDPRNLDNDIIDIWTRASDRERRQITSIAETIVKTGTDD